MLNSRYLIILVLLTVATGLFIFSGKTFYDKRVLDTNSINTGTSKKPGKSLTAKELDSLVSQNDLRSSRYSIVGDKNLFSSDRKAWEPPPPPPPKKKVVEPVKKPPIPIKPIDPSDVFLFGTYTSNGTSLAVMQFNRFLAKRKRKVVAQGDIVRDDEERGQRFYYTICAVEPQKVVLKDANDREFEVELHAAKKLTANHHISALGDPEKNKLVEEGVLKKIDTPFGVVYQETKKVNEKEKKRIEKYKEKYPEKEKMVAEGKMERISTPFGPAYRKIQ